MNENLCVNEKKEMDDAYEDLYAADRASKIPSSNNQPLDPHKYRKPKIITFEQEERMRRAEESKSDLWKIYLEKLGAYNYCVKLKGRMKKNKSKSFL